MLWSYCSGSETNSVGNRSKRRWNNNVQCPCACNASTGLRGLTRLDGHRVTYKVAQSVLGSMRVRVAFKTRTATKHGTLSADLTFHISPSHCRPYQPKSRLLFVCRVQCALLDVWALFSLRHTCFYFSYSYETLVVRYNWTRADGEPIRYINLTRTTNAKRRRDI